MKEQDIEKILQASKPRPSQEFTDQLMDRIGAESQKEQPKVAAFPWPPLWAGLILLGIGIVWFLATGGQFRIPMLKVSISTRGVMGVLSFVFLWMLNQVMILRQQMQT